ncbi:uncharacterized protein ARMOST_18459 [Armillaria ostoyae]|uniref:Uncharacterized protein n=1 Tax=Armillaria ostoyae TaxID=47428 RepID=A0A284S1U0_ARMOS|nr:uncharacterized protein ARMOST_18459 [Armillaria ostoyae]
MDPNARLIRRSIRSRCTKISLSRYRFPPGFALPTLRFFVDELPLEELSGAEK